MVLRGCCIRPGGPSSRRSFAAPAWALGCTLAILSWTADAHATARPEPLEAGAGCERWTGTASGNDPTVELDVELCPLADGLTGRVQWSSLKSGWNIRAVQGTWSEDGQSLTLSDQRIVEEKPEPGWRFCVIDRYGLTRSADDRLQGSYHSSACDDHAKVTLQRVATSSDEAADRAPKPPAPSSARTAEDQPSSPAASPSSPPDRAPTRGCGACILGACPITTPGSSGALPWVLLLVPVVLRRRRASAAPAAPPRC